MTKREERESARMFVIRSLGRELAESRRIVQLHRVNAYGDAYRRGLARAWSVALRALMAAE